MYMLYSSHLIICTMSCIPTGIYNNVCALFFSCIPTSIYNNVHAYHNVQCPVYLLVYKIMYMLYSSPLYHMYSVMYTY